MHRMRLVILLLAGGCSATPASIEIEPEQLLIDKRGGTLQLTARVKDQQGNLMPKAAVTFKAMTPTMATVSPTGLVQAVQSGNATILVTTGSLNKEVEISLQIPKKIEIDPADPWLMLGVTKGFKATVINDRDSPIIAGEVRWSSSEPAVATVDQYGNVKTLTEGETTITAFAAGIQGTSKVTVKHEEVDKDGALSQ